MSESGVIGTKHQKRIAAACTAALLLLGIASSNIAVQARVNDAKYDSYVNMNVTSTGHARYVVPNLYRGDAAYNNVKIYPLVVSGGVDYVPVDIFAQYSYLSVSYSRIGYGFYISNTRSGSYIAFDLESGTTSTNTLLNVDVKSEMFYSTNYVPGAAVCNVLGLRFESYDDEAGGIRAARVSDANGKYTLSELVKMYSPVKRTGTEEVPPSSPSSDEQTQNTPAVNEDTPPAQPQTPSAQPQTPAQGEQPAHANDKTPAEPVPVDPFEKMAARQVYLFADMTAGEDPDTMFRSLAGRGRHAMFLLAPDENADGQTQYAAAETIRRVLGEGHMLCLAFDVRDKDGNVREGTDIIAELERKNTLLAAYCKRKTRYVYTAHNRNTLIENGTADALAAHGFVLLPPLTHFNSGTPAKTIADNIRGALPQTARTVGICLPANGSYDELFALFDKYTAFRVRVPDEFMKLPE